jgi:outer membrane protein
MNKKICFAIFFLFSFYTGIISYGQDSSISALTLRQCIETAIANNADVKNADFTAQSNRVNWQQARGSALPFASASATNGIAQGRSINSFTNTYINQQNTYANYGLSANITLWNGSSISNNIRANNLNFEASEKDLQQAKDNLTINVILDYLQILSNEELLEQAMKQTDVTEKQVERLNLQNNEGSIAPSTLYDLKGQLGAEQVSVVNAQNALISSKIALVQLMNVPYQENMDIQHIDVDSSLVMYDGTTAQIYQQALQNFATIKAADLRKQSAAKALKSARGGLFPVLSLNGGLGTNYSSAATTSQLLNTTDVQTDNYVLYNNQKLLLYTPEQNFANENISYFNQWKNNFNSAISIGLQIPILNGLYARSRVRQAIITQAKDDFSSKQVRTQLQQNIEQAYTNMNSAFERYQTLQSEVENFTVSFHAANIKFNEGVLTSVDYMVAKNNVDQAQINLIAAKYDYALRVKILDYYEGKPLW